MELAVQTENYVRVVTIVFGEEPRVIDEYTVEGSLIASVSLEEEEVVEYSDNSAYTVYILIVSDLLFHQRRQLFQQTNMESELTVSIFL